MSISFSAPDLQPTYQAIIDGSAGYDWAIWNQTNDALKTQATGSGLDDLEEEFMDGRSVLCIPLTRNLLCAGSNMLSPELKTRA
jgi:hypothetical protein